MFDYLVIDNDLEREFEKYDLGIKDRYFIKALIHSKTPEERVIT